MKNPNKISPRQTRCEDCACLVIKNKVWCCDECFGQPCEEIDDCPEGVSLGQIEEINAKAENYKINHEAKTTAVKERKPREPKIDTVKIELISAISQYLTDNFQGISNVSVENAQKIITFDVENDHFKLDLIKQRPKK